MARTCVMVSVLRFDAGRDGEEREGGRAGVVGEKI